MVLCYCAGDLFHAEKRTNTWCNCDARACDRFERKRVCRLPQTTGVIPVNERKLCILRMRDVASAVTDDGRLCDMSDMNRNEDSRLFALKGASMTSSEIGKSVCAVAWCFVA